MVSLMDIAIIAIGVYILYIYYRMKFKGEVREGMMLPKGTSFEKCKDKEGYIREMSGKVLLYGILVLVCGVAGFLEDEYLMLGKYYFLVPVGFIAITIWFAAKSGNAIRKFW